MGKYREVICPYCQHKYMIHIIDNYFDVKINHDSEILQGWNDKCPMCSHSLYIIDNILKGITLEEYPEDEVDITYNLR